MWLRWLSHNSFTMTTTIWSQKEEVQLVITTTRTTFPFSKSVSPVFGVAPLSMQLGWLRYALFVLAKELILCPYLQMRLILTISANQLVWASHSNPSILKDKEREAIRLQNKRHICKLWQIKNACKPCNYYRMYLGLGSLFFISKRAKNAIWIVIRRNISTTSDISTLSISSMDLGVFWRR
jgi:hypothetical protein